jgi:lysophospholipase L1-like esterase
MSAESHPRRGGPARSSLRRRLSAAVIGLLAVAATTVGTGAIADDGGREAAAAGRPWGPRTAAWVGTWASVPTAVPPTGVTTLEDQTVRQVVHTSVGGTRAQLRLTNEFGAEPLLLGDVHVARRAGDSGTDIVPITNRQVTFSGHQAVTVPAGAPVVSDPVALRVPPRADLVVSIHLPRRTEVTTVAAFAFQENVVAAGNVTADRSVTATSTITQWFFLSGASVRTHRRCAAAVVALGDSITNGANTVVNANHRWPDLLSERFREDRRLRRLGVLNLGVSGNRLLHDPNPPAGDPAEQFAAYFGESALRRFDRDVLAQPGRRYVIVLLGVNDLGHPGTVAPESETVSADDIIAGHRQLIARAHAHGLSIYGGTILPFENDTLGFYSAENEAKRQRVNRWIRSSGEYDAVVDFDAALRDPARPTRLLPAYDSGDHLHPNDAGMAAMARAVPLRLFR